MRSKNRIGVVISEDDEEDDLKPRYCEACQNRGYLNKLGAKIILQGKEPEPDHDLWLQCYDCFSIYPKYATKSEQALEGFAETSDNPFEDNKVFESIPRRSTPAGKKASDKRKREKNRMHHHDKEIDELLRIYGEDRVKIHYDSMPEGDTC
jgi:hypothetical protein